MSHSLIVRPAAESDLVDARRWYEEQREGLGDDLLLCVEETLDRIRRMPELNAPGYRGIRRALIRRFPYVVYYRFDGSMISVLAVMHGRRDPKDWQSRA